MRLLTAAEQRELDRLAAEEAQLPTRVLMESAGAAVARAVLALAPKRVAVYCGPGNNGGDGFVAARLLREQGLQVHTIASRRDSEAASAWYASGGADGGGAADVVVDAVFGSGLSRPPAGAEAEMIRAMNDSGARIVSVDIPSGVESDTGAVYPVHVARADVTVTFHAPKRGLYLHPGAACSSRIEVADIGIPAALEERLAGPVCELIDEPWALRHFPRRRRDAHKNDFGHVLVVAGSFGKSGAAAMVCEAALRAGAGLVTLAAPREVLQLVMPGLPEVMGVVFDGDVAVLKEAARGKTAVAIGPGLQRTPDTGPLIGELLGSLDGSCAVVIDADGLNALAEHRERIAEWMRRAHVLLTPHPGEFARLTGEEVERIQADRLDAAARAAQRFGAHVVLKGAHSVVAEPEGATAVCAAGNPGMATAGSGDVLTGIAAGLLARRGAGGLGEVARLAVFVHAFAGDLAAAELSETALIATDIVRTGLPRVFRRWSR